MKDINIKHVKYKIPKKLMNGDVCGYILRMSLQSVLCNVRYNKWNIHLFKHFNTIKLTGPYCKQ